MVAVVIAFMGVVIAAIGVTIAGRLHVPKWHNLSGESDVASFRFAISFTGLSGMTDYL